MSDDLLSDDFWQHVVEQVRDAGGDLTVQNATEVRDEMVADLRGLKFEFASDVGAASPDVSNEKLGMLKVTGAEDLAQLLVARLQKRMPAS